MLLQQRVELSPLPREPIDLRLYVFDGDLPDHSDLRPPEHQPAPLRRCAYGSTQAAATQLEYVATRKSLGNRLATREPRACVRMVDARDQTLQLVTEDTELRQEILRALGRLVTLLNKDARAYTVPQLTDPLRQVRSAIKSLSDQHARDDSISAMHQREMSPLTLLFVDPTGSGTGWLKRRLTDPERRELLKSLAETFDDSATTDVDRDALRESKQIAWPALASDLRNV